MINSLVVNLGMGVFGMMYNIKKFDDLDMGTQVVVKEVYMGKCFDMNEDRVITRTVAGVFIMSLVGKVLGIVNFDDIESHCLI